MNTPVSFEIAKLLKQKGYDIPCLKCYLEDGLVQISSGDEGDSDVYNHNQWDNYSAPPIVEVVMWLYEKHGIWIYPKTSFKIINDEALDSFTPVIERRTEFDINNLGEFKSPTEAYEAAIHYTLKNLMTQDKPKLEDFYDVNDPRGCSSSEFNEYLKALENWQKTNESGMIDWRETQD